MHDTFDLRVRAHCESGELDAAINAIVSVYGPPILGHLRARLRNEFEAHEVFALFCEDAWRGLPSFEWRCALKSWLFTVARRAEARHIAASRRRRTRIRSMSSVPELAAPERLTTDRYRRTGVKNSFRALRARLTDEDQRILDLRVDRALGWSEIALQVGSREDTHTTAGRAREAARMRKRFQSIRARLRAWAIEDGLLV